MQALVVFESTFGNTEAIARAVAQGLSRTVDVGVADVAGAPEALPEGVQLLVVGGPTQAFGMSRPQTRQDAARQAGRPVADADRGIREWLAGLARPSTDLLAATFDTRVHRPRVPGSAARGASRRLRHLGFRLAAQPHSFWVTGTPGPLLEGELERACRWGEQLAGQLAPADRSGRAGETRRS